MEGSDWNPWFGCLVATIPYKRSQTIQPSVQIAPTSLNEGRDRWKSRATAARKRSEATMATLVVVLGGVTIIAGICIGAFLKVSFRIRSVDRIRGSLRSTGSIDNGRAPRQPVGVSAMRWD